MSTRRIGAYTVAATAALFEDRLFFMQVVMPVALNIVRDINYDFRKIITGHMSHLLMILVNLEEAQR